MKEGAPLKKILIVEDEYLVRIGLRATVDWHEHGFEIVGEASSGAEALILFEKTDPDILLTDIQMPEMDGLQLIEKLKNKKPSLHVIVLSNHSDFSYAQKAMKLGVNNYLLKSELNQKNILQTLQQAFFSASEVEPSLLDRPDHSLKEYLRSVLLSSKRVTNLPLPKNPFQSSLLAALLCKCNTSTLSPQSQPSFYRFSRSIFENLWHQSTLVSTQIDNFLYVLLCCPLETSDSFTLLNHKAKVATNNLFQYYNLQLHMGLSLQNHFNQLPISLKQAFTACNDCFFTNGSFSLFDKDFSPTHQQIHVNQKWISELVATEDLSRLLDYIKTTFLSLTPIRDMAFVQEVLNDFLSCARQLTLVYPLLENHFKNTDQLSYLNANQMDNINACIQFISDLFTSIIHLLSSHGQYYSNVISQVIAYIHENYQKNLSLNSASDVVNLSPSHLSFLFKQETGINFSKYLTDYRIEKAKTLLNETNLHIYQVAEKVGIPNPHYFSKVFKDSTGLSCKAYKNARL